MNERPIRVSATLRIGLTSTKGVLGDGYYQAYHGAVEFPT